MTKSLLKFKDAIVDPLKNTISQYKSPTLSQFKSLDDIKIQWARAEGLEISLNHIEKTYTEMVSENSKEENVVEILPPQ